MRRPLGAWLALALISPVGLAADRPPTPEALVEQLGSPVFAEREAAARKLLSHRDAHDLLARAADSHTDPEVRWRAGLLVEQLKRSAESAGLLTAKTVKLEYHQVPLGTALADVRTKTGVPLTLDPQKVADPLRLVTVKTGELPVWEAIEAFCRQAGVKEVFQETLGGPTEEQAIRGRRRIAYAIPPNGGLETAGQVPVVLADGIAELSGDRSAAVRVLALPASFPGNRVIRGAGQVVVNLDVTPLPGVRWDEVRAVRVTRAEDETGRPVTLSHRGELRGAVSGAYEEVMWIGGAMPAQMVWGGDVYLSGPALLQRPNPRVVPVTLKTDDRAIQSLRIFEGVVIGEITLPNQSLAVITDLAKSAGVTAPGPADTKFTVFDYKVLPNGRVSLKVRSEGPNPWTMRQGGRRGGIILNNVTVWDGPAPPGGGLIQFKFTDATGKPIPSPQQQSTSMSDDGVRQTSEVELIFPKRSDVGPPATLTVVGNKPATVEVPFRMRNVPLP